MPTKAVRATKKTFIESMKNASPKAKRGRKPKADVIATDVTPTEARAVADFIGSQPIEGAAPSIEALVQALYALGVSSVHLTFSKEGA